MTEYKINLNSNTDMDIHELSMHIETSQKVKILFSVICHNSNIYVPYCTSSVISVVEFKLYFSLLS